MSDATLFIFHTSIHISIEMPVLECPPTVFGFYINLATSSLRNYIAARQGLWRKSIWQFFKLVLIQSNI